MVNYEKKYKKEKELRRDVIKYLNSLDGCFAFPIEPVPGRGQKGIPDIIFFYRGYGGAIELKAEGKNPTDLQQRFLRLIEVKGGGISYVAHNIKEVEKCLKKLCSIKGLGGLSYQSNGVTKNL